MAKIETLAPTLVESGVSPKELKAYLRPLKPKGEPPKARPQKKRYEQVVRILAKDPSLKDDEVARLVTTFTPAEVAELRLEIEAVRAKLAALEPVDEGTDDDKGEDDDR